LIDPKICAIPSSGIATGFQPSENLARRFNTGGAKAAGLGPISGRRQGRFDVALGINDRDPFRTDQIGSVRQTPQKEMFNQNRWHILFPNVML
jgi:hypothetical protein